MPQSLARIWLHVVFSIKDRCTYLLDDGFRDELFRMIGRQVKQIGCVAVRTGGWHDHSHLVCGLSRIVTVASFVEHVKVEKSKWAKHADRGFSTFSWQSGYGVFSVSQSNLAAVVNYMDAQPRTTKNGRFRTNFANCAAATDSTLMNDTFGIE